MRRGGGRGEERKREQKRCEWKSKTNRSKAKTVECGGKPNKAQQANDGSKGTDNNDNN